MFGSATAPQVVVRGAAMLRVDPEIAELAVSVTGRARDRQTALERCRARQDEVRAVVAAAARRSGSSSPPSPSGG